MTSRSAYQTTYSQADNKSQDYYQQLENIAKKERFGLFTQPPPLAVLDKYGRPISPGGPRNFYTNPKLQSQVEPSLFQVPSSILQGDPYRDPYKGKQITDQQRVASIPHGYPFRPTDAHKTIVGSQYEHMKEFDDKTYNTRDEYGTIMTGPKNFLTNPNKRGLGNTTVGHLFNPVSYGNDPYHRAKEMDVKERADHKSKVLDLKRPFCSTQHGKGVFNSQLETYGQDRPIVEGLKRNYNYPPAYHPKCFKNGDNPKQIFLLQFQKQGFNKTFTRFPQYSEEGQYPRPWKKIQPSITQGYWKPNSEGTFSRPTPAITSMVLNRNKMTSFRR